jgi:ADP-ribose pyrophosphatase
MARSRRPDDGAVADRPGDVAVSPPEPLAKAYRNYERYRITFTGADGQPVCQTRDVLRAGHVVGVLAIDPGRDELVLIRQFRLPAHLATGKGELVEIVAGYVDAGEDAPAAARRECIEEIGVAPGRLVELLTFMPAPGTSDEHATLFLAAVDATAVPARTGAAGESEHLEPMRIAVDAALAALTQGKFQNGYLIIALQWLALNRHRLDAIVRECDTSC